MDATTMDDLGGRVFEPVPLRARHDGWTAARQGEFVAALAECGCVVDACRRVGLSAESAYRLRARDDAADFRRVWDEALDDAVDRLEDAALSRALHGVAVPKFYKGEVVGETRRFDERLTLFILRHRRPEVYARAPERDEPAVADIGPTAVAAASEVEAFFAEHARQADAAVAAAEAAIDAAVAEADAYRALPDADPAEVRAMSQEIDDLEERLAEVFAAKERGTMDLTLRDYLLQRDVARTSSTSAAAGPAGPPPPALNRQARRAARRQAIRAAKPRTPAAGRP